MNDNYNDSSYLAYFQMAPVTMSLAIPDGANPKKLSIYRILEDGTRKNMNGKVNGNKIEFLTDSICALYEVLEDKTDDGIAPPTIVESTNSTWKYGSKNSLVLRSSGSFASFTGIMVDGEIIDPTHYTIREGSIIVELKSEYLASLAVGKHTVSINSTEGNVSTNITIEKDNDVAVVKTSDPLSISVEMLLLTMISMLFVISKISSKDKI